MSTYSKRAQPIKASLAAILGVVIASPALSVDGVIEINQTCAANTGCSSEDAAGFPVTIDERGSHRLTRNLSLATTTPHAIEITSTLRT